MRRLIASILPIISPQSQDQQPENKKIIYWLEKLFNQRKDKEKRDLKEQVKIQSDVTNTIPPTIKIEQSLEKKGLNQAVKNHADKAEKNRKAVEDMVSNSNRILLKVSSVFPWDLFPSSIVLEETRLTVIHRQLFSSQVHSVNIKDVVNIFIDTGILFAQLTIVSNTFAENQIIINRLWKKDAIFMRRLIEGLRMFISKDIDTSDYKVEDLINKLKELSTTVIVL
jgi:hypothetical protein